MDNIAIIPARGGSKRIPRKNIKDFYGKPIIAYAIEAAKETELFSNIVVSTDDEEIAEIAIKYGANVPFLRSSENADDFATTAAVIEEVLGTFSKHLVQYDNGCCIYPTTPLISVEKLRLGYKSLTDEHRDSVFPVLKFSYPIWRSVQFVQGDLISMIWPEFENSRSQDLKEAYHDAGQWYWFNSKAFNVNKTFFTKNTGSIILSEFEAQDIDTIEDWFLAEKKYQFKHKKNQENEKI